MSRAAPFPSLCLVALCLWLAGVAQAQEAPSFRLVRYSVQPLQAFQLDALVLGREDYYFGREAELSPTDLALGWGPLGDPALAARIRFSQSGRWYHWHADPLPLPRREIETHSANMHLIPANRDVARTLEKVSAGERVHITGQLVRITGDDSWQWVSSLSREDIGAGSCELIWVEQLRIDAP